MKKKPGWVLNRRLNRHDETNRYKRKHKMTKSIYSLTAEYQDLFGENKSLFVVVDQKTKGRRLVAPIGESGPIYSESIWLSRTDLVLYQE